MRVCLFEDRWADLEPLSLTRPVFDLRCGMHTLGSKQMRYFALSPAGVLLRPHLEQLYRLQHPEMAVNDLGWLRSGATILVNGRWLPPSAPPANLDRPCVVLVDEEVAYAVVGPEQLRYCSLHTLEDCLETWKKVLPCRQAGGWLVNYPWDLVAQNGQQLEEDAVDFVSQVASPGVGIVGPADRLHLEPTAQLEPQVVVDTRHGPVMIAAGAAVTAFSRLEGPCYIGPGTQVLGAKIRAGTTLGPQCRIGGEVEASIVHGHSNKYHDGFLGHSYVGEWVNLGAGTSNSDLRNDYGPVKVTCGGRLVATGQSKVGCFLGDHTKTGLGTLINTGTSVGAFCNLLPAGRFAPKYVPSFISWWQGSLQANTDLDQLLATARTVMHRRSCVLTLAHVDLYRHLCTATLPERRRVLEAAERQSWRRSA